MAADERGAPLAGLARALAAERPDLAGLALEPLADKGLAHWHCRLVGRGLLARIPKQSQMRLGAADNLAYQRACFERASLSGATPRLEATLAPSAALPRGALIVEEIFGEPARLPQDLAAILRALAAIHALEPPPAPARAPLLNAADPLADLIGEVDAQAKALAPAGVAAETMALIAEGRAALTALAAQPSRPPRRLISFDAHPGNFLIRADGSAVLVDLEKARYGYPPLDLAHATLYTSTTWDVESRAELSEAETDAAYEAWAEAAPAALAKASRPWFGALRLGMLLWSLTWCALWRAEQGAPAKGAEAGQDWSAEHSSAPLIAHVEERTRHYLAPQMAARLFADVARFTARFGAPG